MSPRCHTYMCKNITNNTTYHKCCFFYSHNPHLVSNKHWVHINGAWRRLVDTQLLLLCGTDTRGHCDGTYWDGRHPQSMSTERHAADHTPKLSKNKPRMGQQWGLKHQSRVRTEWQSEINRSERQEKLRKEKLIVTHECKLKRWIKDKIKAVILYRTYRTLSEQQTAIVS